jgi:hypothetical protein
LRGIEICGIDEVESNAGISRHYGEGDAAAEKHRAAPIAV